MKYKKVFLSVMFGVSLILSALLPYDISENYLNNINIATSATPYQRSLVKIENTNLNYETFMQFRQNIFQLTNRYANGFRAIDKDSYTIKYNSIEVGGSNDLLDYDFDHSSTYNTSLIFVSYGKMPTVAEPNHVVIEYNLASIIQTMEELNDIGEVVGKTITLEENTSQLNINTSNCLDFVIGGIYHKNNKKDFVSYANMFYKDSFESPIFISRVAFDNFNFDGHISFYATLVQKPGLDYVDRSYKLIYELVDKNTMNITFPSVASNNTEPSCSIDLPSLHDDILKIAISPEIRIFSLLLTLFSLIITCIIIKDDIALLNNVLKLSTTNIWKTLVFFPLVSLLVIMLISLLSNGNVLLLNIYFYTINSNTLLWYLLNCVVYLVVVILMTTLEKKKVI